MSFTRLTGEVANVHGMIKLKRLGKIRLGIKRKSNQSGAEYPVETPHFVVPPEVAESYGENPKILSGAMFASNNPEEVYIEKLAWYGKNTGLKCHGNGEKAERRQENGVWLPRTCPCEQLKTEENPKGQCRPKADLMVMLPKVSMWGNYQITTHSTIARAGILSSLKDLRGMLGRIAYVPLRLERIPQVITHDGKQQTHYIVGFTPDLTAHQILDLRQRPELMVLPGEYQIEGPVDTNPEDDPVDECVDEDPQQEDPDAIEAARLAEMEEAELKAVQDKLNAKREADRKAKDATAKKAAPAPPAEPEPAHKPESPTLIGASQWAVIIKAIQADREWNDHLGVFVSHHGIADPFRLNLQGQQTLLKYFRKTFDTAFRY